MQTSITSITTIPLQSCKTNKKPVHWQSLTLRVLAWVPSVTKIFFTCTNFSGFSPKYFCRWLNLKTKGPAGHKVFSWNSSPVVQRGTSISCAEIIFTQSSQRQFCRAKIFLKMKSITDSYLFSFLAMRRSLAIRAFTRAFRWKIFGKHFSMTYFLCFHSQAQIGIQFWNSRLWNAHWTHTHFRVFLHESLIRSRRSCSNHFFGNFLFFAGKLRKVSPLSLPFSVWVLQPGARTF